MADVYRAPCELTVAHRAHDQACDSGCQPDWHKDSCAIYGRCPGMDPTPETIGSPYHHEDERECFYRADGSGWWPWRFEDGVLNRSGGTVCFRLHPDPSKPSYSPGSPASEATE